MKKRRITIVLFILIGSVFTTSFTLASRVSWPDSPAGHPFPEKGIPELIQYFYEWGIGLGGIFVFIALIIAGFQYLTSVGDPAKIKEAKDRIRSALFGLVLLLGSWLILNTINPQFTTFPEVKLDLARLSRIGEERVFERKGPLCELAYVYEEKDYEGKRGIIDLNEVVVDTWGDFDFKNGVSIDEPVSVRQMRHIQCFGYNYNNPETENPEDELLPIIRQAIGACQNNKLMAMKEEEILTEKPECGIDEIIGGDFGIEEFLLRTYNNYFEIDGSICPPYLIKEEVFGIEYNFPNLPRYFINSGSCALQLHKAKFGVSGCGEMIAEIPATNRDITRVIDANIECIKLVPYSEEP